MSDTAIREMDWYLRDHLFRQSNAEQRSCLRCQHAELHDFPRKKA